MRLIRHSARLVIVKLPPETDTPAWAWSGSFSSVTRTRDELSVVCESSAVPTANRPSASWVRLEVEGPLPFSLTGVLAALAVPLAEAGVTLFPIATHETDHLLVPKGQVERAIDTLIEAGHEVVAAATRT
jgi:hypothetical protein